TIVNHVAATREPLLTDNAQTSFSNTESVVMMALRSILCVPIIVRDEKFIGMVYVDNRMHIGQFDEQHLDLLMAFARQAGIAIENARLYKIAVEKGRLQRELEMARGIQRALLPVDFQVLPGYEVAVDWDSANEVAGDFYDCLILEHGTAMGIVIADVSGKGAPAAIFMAVARSLIRGNAIASASPEDTLRQSNRLIISDAGASGMFVTVYYAIFKTDGHVIGVNAGHNLPLLWRYNDGEVEWLPRGGRALGWFDDLPVEPRHYQLLPGDVLIFYTDGLTEAENIYGEAYGEARLATTIQQYVDGKTAAEIKDMLLQDVNAFVGEAPPFDDRTIVVVRYVGEAGT
ncbi:MAG TPA: GAF domain-containing SpoIIE family protein phosphatase, partial [Aggregatilineales bacterium]|nr:GAF domain-containing SpoIIE family protein phosphatase [Aggregatilineales bacterium]